MNWKWPLMAYLLFSCTCYAQSAAPSASGIQPVDQAQSEQATIGPGDLLDISVFAVPELTLKVRVNDQGSVMLPLVGDMHFGGLTVAQAEQALSKILVERDMVLKPQITIFVTEYATQGITILGEVNQPGTYPLFGPHRLFDALSAAGGVTQRSSSTITLIHRGDHDHPIHLNLAVTNTNVGTDVVLQPGDTLIVDKAPVVYVVGEVNKPGAFLMENNTSITVLRAVALAQGATHKAALNKAEIVRRSPVGVEEIDLPLSKIMHGQMADLQLHGDDILFLPTSKAKVSAQKGVEAILAATIGLAEFGRL
jgi:polysaccharide export outer membrane protein